MLLDEGQAPDVETFLAQHPEHAEELRKYFSLERRKGAVLAGSGQDRTKPHRFRLLDGNVPTTFDRYELIRGIARGGMGEAYLARQAELDRLVVVKVISAGRLDDETAQARFENEAKLAARLSHPNIVSVHEAGQFEGQPYFSMD